MKQGILVAVLVTVMVLFTCHLIKKFFPACCHRHNSRATGGTGINAGFFPLENGWLTGLSAPVIFQH